MPKKISGKSVDGAQQNFEQVLDFLAQIFPSCVIEKRVADADSEDQSALVRDIDWQVLGNMIGKTLSCEENELLRREPFGFCWAGKNEAAREATRPISMALRPCPNDSVEWDHTGNLYLEGDNLQALKLLQGSYLGKVKMIYIDPPYNTGKDTFGYVDDFAQSREEFAKAYLLDEETGARLISSKAGSGRYHSQWCSMMYSRLQVARSLLHRDGVIFISIDDYEAHHLRAICDEVFGEYNFIAQLVWQRTTAPKNDAKYISNSHDYILMYARDLASFTIGRPPLPQRIVDTYTNPDNDPRGPWKPDNFSVKTRNVSCVYPITTPTGKQVYPPEGRAWLVSKERYQEYLADNRIYFAKDGDGSVGVKRFLSERKRDGITPTSLLLAEDIGTNADAAKALKELMQASVFTGPKPVSLLRHLLTLANLDPHGGDIVLDFFSGSATTAEAVMRANAEDGGNRRFIRVQLPEPCEEDGTAAAAGFKTLCEVGKARSRAVAKDIASSFDCTKIVHGGGTRVLDKYENADSPTQSTLSTASDQLVNPDNTGSTSSAFTLEDLDLGFRVFKVASSNFLPSYFQVDAISQDMLATLEGNIKHDRSDLDLLFECVLDWHLPLSCPFKTETIAGHQVYDYNDGDLLACFETGVGEAFVHALAQRELKPLRVVMRDSCFQDSASKINLSELFKTVLPEVQLRVI